MFVSSFYCYLNYDKNIDFIVDLDDVWKWLGFSQKIRAKECLDKYFKLDIDYKLAFCIEKASLDNENPIILKDNQITQNLALGKGKASDKWGGNNIWDTIAKAAEDENMSPAKMSRIIKNKAIFNEDYYYKI